MQNQLFSALSGLGSKYAKMSFEVHVNQWSRFDIESSCENGLFWPLKFEKIEKKSKIYQLGPGFELGNPGM